MDKETIYRQDVLDLAKKGVLISNGNYESVCKAINEIPPVNPTEPCKDAIDRAEAIKIASGYCHPANVAKELAKLPAVNPQPCEDAISRQAVKELYYKDGYIDFRKICELPPVNPQPKTGHWIEHKINGMAYIECSECSSWFLRMYLTRNSYCPNCGAKMVEPQERSDKE